VSGHCTGSSIKASTASMAPGSVDGSGTACSALCAAVSSATALAVWRSPGLNRSEKFHDRPLASRATVAGPSATGESRHTSTEQGVCF
jgi:hypothetical protein